MLTVNQNQWKYIRSNPNLIKKYDWLAIKGQYRVDMPLNDSGAEAGRIEENLLLGDLVGLTEEMQPDYSAQVAGNATDVRFCFETHHQKRWDMTKSEQVAQSLRLRDNEKE